MSEAVDYNQLLKELTDKVNMLQFEITTIEAPVASLQKQADEKVKEVKSIQEQEEALRIEVEKQFDEFRLAQRAIHAEKHKIEQEIYAHKSAAIKQRNALAKLEQEKLRLIELVAAQSKLDDLHKRLEEMVQGAFFWDKARDYQKQDILYMLGAYDQGLTGVLNALDMSLGKTAESACFDEIVQEVFFKKHGRLPRVLWLTKKSLVKTTYYEIRRWNPSRRIILFDKNPTPHQREFITELAVANNAMLLVNYDALNSTPALMEVEWDFVYADEVHKLKGGADCNCSPIHSTSSKKCKATGIWQKAAQLIEKLRNRGGFFMPLSGSPIQNRPHEMWSYLHLFDPVRFPSVRRFDSEYCFGYGTDKKVSFETLIQAMKNQVIRRKKTDPDVHVSLPDLEWEYRYLEHTEKQREVYEKIRDQFFYELDKEAGAVLTATAIIAKLTRLRQINVGDKITVKNFDGVPYSVDCSKFSAKIDEAMEIIEELVVRQGEQVVLFTAQFNEPIFEIQRRVQELQVNGRNASCVALTGANSDQTNEIQVAFQNKETDVLCINMATGAEGLNLHKDPTKWEGGSTNGIFLDLWYNPETNNQAKDRLWRPGQSHQGVVLYCLLVEDSVDKFITDLLEKKSDMIEGIVDADSMKRTGADWKTYLSDLI